LVFSDPVFLFAFLPVVFVIFHLVAGRFGSTAGLAVILAASVAFYAPHGLFNLALLGFSVTINFAIGALLLNLPDTRQQDRFRLFVVGESFNFLVLCWFKYHFFTSLILPADHKLNLEQIIIPVGISFYTFHQAAFIADAYAREASVRAYLGELGTLRAKVKSFVRYAAFVTFFPQLVIGPITYLHEFQPQVMRRHFGRIKRVEIAIGLTLIAIGLFKKLVIADRLAIPANDVFDTIIFTPDMQSMVALRGVVCYYAQLYFDFSGYSDMALGIAMLFGIRFPANFYSPLKAVGIIDFYRRWHMTLTRVIARFLFTPLSLLGTRFAIRRRLPKSLIRPLSLWIPLLINFEVIGLWHGSAITFLLFGLIHGAWYVLETEVRAAKAWKAWKKKTPDAVRATLGRLLFVVPMMFTFALFRSESPAAFGQLLTVIASGPADLAQFLGPYITIIVPAFAIIYLLPNSVQLLKRFRPALLPYDNADYGPMAGALRWSPTWPWAIFFLGLVVASVYYIGTKAPFLYAGF
jgi:D-alanyl-lipoteichoic acid acyltransferase DltB (MBOAT superfamily)